MNITQALKTASNPRIKCSREVKRALQIMSNHIYQIHADRAQEMMERRRGAIQKAHPNLKLAHVAV